MTVERRWLDFVVIGLPTLALELGDLLLVEHPDQDYGLVDTALARVWRLEEDSRKNETEIGVWL